MSPATKSATASLNVTVTGIGFRMVGSGAAELRVTVGPVVS
jgi:hypothetical protein